MIIYCASTERLELKMWTPTGLHVTHTYSMLISALQKFRQQFPLSDTNLLQLHEKEETHNLLQIA
jgi:hypothetical protein